jgi:hypothetical protein
MFLPTNCSGREMFPFSGTCTCSLHRPNPKSRTSSTPVDSVGGLMQSCSATWSRPVIPRSTFPSPTNVGISAAGRKTSAIGKFLTSAMSSRECRWNCMSAPLRSSRHGG